MMAASARGAHLAWASARPRLADHRFAVVEQAGVADVEPRWGLPAIAIGNERVVFASSAS